MPRQVSILNIIYLFIICDKIKVRIPYWLDIDVTTGATFTNMD